jgi:hypothetical protein
MKVFIYLQGKSNNVTEMQCESFNERVSLVEETGLSKFIVRVGNSWILTNPRRGESF